MTFQELSQLLIRSYHSNKPFAVYCLPDSEEVIAFIQKDDTLYHPQDKESGFLMTSFLTDRHLIIPLEQSDRYFCDLEPTEVSVSGDHDQALDQSDHDRYTAMVDDAIIDIQLERSSKIVLSRKYQQSLSNMDLGILLHRLMHAYKNAMRYVWFHPQTGIWCGATPEVLIEVWGNTFKTMALAGTKPYNEIHPPKWTPKEVSEQQWVKDAIADRISKYTSLLKVSKTENHKAGNLMHLKTNFSGVMHKQKKIGEMIDALHPTPAVCGSPQKQARDFIVKHEGYDRSFYTGYLGPRCEISKETKLFVNLRCMQLEEGQATLFAGGGITAGSVPEDEWEETQNKLKTMLDVLAPLV